MNNELHPKQRLHFVGIGGSGMGGIAEVLLTQGYAVSGSDLGNNQMTQRLANLGATIFYQHEASNVVDVDLVIVSSAIDENNPEMIAAKAANIPVIPRAKMLANLMQAYFGIAIAGTHGKTTTTSLIASILGEAGFDPTFVIGGLLKSAGCNAQLGAGQFFVAEADESDGSFLFLDPKMVVVTNIDADHLIAYNNDFGKLKQTFLQFLDRVPADGLRVLCIDDPVIRELFEQINGRKISYGFSDDAQVQCIEVRPDGMQTHFTVSYKPTNQRWQFTLNLPGRHNVENSLAAIAVALELGADYQSIQSALTNFAGVGRRLQMLGEFKTAKGYVALVDDYGHHPREIAATVSALRDVWPNRRLVMVFQPHRYTRTQDLWNDFVDVLQQPEQLMLLDIYPASESPIEHISSERLSATIHQKAHNAVSYVKDIEDLKHYLAMHTQDGDVILMQGAGTIGRLARELAEQKLSFIDEVSNNESTN